MQESLLRCFFLLIVFLLRAGAGVTEPVPSDIARVLLSAPVNASWAANNTRYWSEKGFQGFIFQGYTRFDEVANCTPETLDACATELRWAQSRLAKAGIAHNFLHLSMTPATRWFADRDLAQKALQQVELTARLSKQSGVHGIALDTCPDSFLYDFHWDGYILSETPPERLLENASWLGRKITSTLLRTQPDAALLVYADSLLAASPLWFAFWEGLIQGVGAAENTSLTLVIRSAQRTTEPEVLQSVVATSQALLKQRLSNESIRIWKRCGAISLSLEPLGYEEDTPVAHTSPQKFSVQLAAAKTYASRYVVIDAPFGGWWQVADKEVFAYGALKQGAPAQVKATLPLVEGMCPAEEGKSPWLAKTVLDKYTPVGPLPESFGGSDTGVVFKGKKGAAIALWQGMPLPYEETERHLPLEVYRLETGEAHTYYPKEGVVHIPAQSEPVLIDGLSLWRWSAPAALRFTWDVLPEARRTQASATVSYTQTAATPLAGFLNLTPPPGYSIGVTPIPVQLYPEETFQMQRRIQGMFGLGESLSFQLTLTVPGEETLTKTFGFSVAPQEIQHMPLDGVLTAPPAVFYVTTPDETAFKNPPLRWHGSRYGRRQEQYTHMVVATKKGHIVCLDETGKQQWQRYFHTGFVAGPVVAQSPTGKPLIALCDVRGHVYLLTDAGEVYRELDLDEACAPGQLQVHPRAASQGDLLVLGFPSGRLLGIPVSDALPWEFVTEETPLIGDTQAPDSTPRKHAPVYAVTSTTLFALTPEGKGLFQTPLQVMPTCSPKLRRSQDGTAQTVWVGEGNGVLESFDAFSGERLMLKKTDAGHAISALLVESRSGYPHQTLFAADTHNVYCFSEASDAPEWSFPLSGATQLCLYGVGATPWLVAATVNAGLCGLSVNGSLLWRETRPVGRNCTAPTLFEAHNRQHVLCAYAATDQILRLYQIPHTGK